MSTTKVPRSARKPVFQANLDPRTAAIMDTWSAQSGASRTALVESLMNRVPGLDPADRASIEEDARQLDVARRSRKPPVPAS